MQQRITLQAAYLLHARPYRDTSLLVELFTQDHGRITAVARGARKKRDLQPFSPLLVSWFGKSELVTLGTIECTAANLYTHPHALFSGLYLNELLIRALHHHDPHPSLYTAYAQTIHSLMNNEQDLENILRSFEKDLLKETGYGLCLSHIQANQRYHFDPAKGFTQTDTESEWAFSGESLLALASDTLTTSQHRSDAKRLMRRALLPIIGAKPLKSRELFLKNT